MAAVPAIAIAALAVGLANLASSIVHDIIDIADDDGRLSRFTQVLCNRSRILFPRHNVMIVADGVDHDKNFVNMTAGHQVCPLSLGRSWGFQVFVFSSGDFQLKGPGGFRNWCFSGEFQRNDKHVTFSVISNNTPIPALPSANPPIRNPPATKDGLLLVNSEKNGVWTSGLAWYRDIAFNRDGNPPDAYIDIKTDGTVTWEGQTITGTFPDGNKFWASIRPDAHNDSVPLFAEVGHAANDYRGMKVFKDRWRIMYEVDGWKVFTVYWCN